MHYLATHNPYRDIIRLLCVFAILASGGCARQPWADPAGEEEYSSITMQLDLLTMKSNECREMLEADLLLSYNDPLRSYGLQGYLRISPSGEFRFISSNPLGQPLFVVSGDSSSFQSINTLERRYLAGSLRSFALRQDVPLALVEAKWWEWLTGSLIPPANSEHVIRHDRDARGFWVSFHNENSKAHGQENILIEPQSGRIISRLLTDADKTLARLDYEEYQDVNQCSQPTRLSIHDLYFGAELTIELHDVTHSSEDAALNERLPIPRGYSRQYLP